MANTKLKNLMAKFAEEIVRVNPEGIDDNYDGSSVITCEIIDKYLKEFKKLLK